jgi:hypothetical protein
MSSACSRPASTHSDAHRSRLDTCHGLLDWLRTRGLTLATCRQGDLDLWLTSNDDSPRFGAGHFVHWVISERINRTLQFAATRWTGPADNPADPSAPTDSANASGQLGLRPGQARSAALFQLATELPADISRWKTNETAAKLP